MPPHVSLLTYGRRRDPNHWFVDVVWWYLRWRVLRVIPLQRTSGVPMSRQIYIGLRQAILDGTFHAGERLPSTRAMADQLSVSRTIVVIAYEQLLAEGFVSG